MQSILTKPTIFSFWIVVTMWEEEEVHYFGELG